MTVTHRTRMMTAEHSPARTPAQGCCTSGGAMTFTPGKGRSNKYGAEHQAERKRRAARHEPTDPCARCRCPLGPMTPHLHLDHDEHGGYLGFSHGFRCPHCGRKCNVGAGASKGAKATNAKRKAATFVRRTW